MSAHALLAPSSAPQWAYCAGSVKVNANRLDVETPESREGTAAHWVAFDACLRNCVRDASALLGGVTPEGTVIDEKIVEGAQCMIDDVVDTHIHQPKGSMTWFEHRVGMPRIHPENWGTLDAALYVPHLSRMYLWDYKHGHGLVDAKLNYQLIDYLAGLVGDIGINTDIDIVFRIVQPFAYRSTGPVDEWTCKLSEMAPEFARLKRQAIEAMGDNPTLTTGKHCRYCAGVGRCAAAKSAGYNFVDAVNAPYHIDTMDGASLALEKEILEGATVLAKARVQAIEDELKHRIKNGDTSTGLALETSLGNNKWSVPPEQAIVFARQFGVDIAKTVPCTPTQAVGKAPSEVKAVFAAAIKTISKREASGLKLISAEDSISHRAFKKRV